MTVDPLAEMVSQLQLAARFSKLVEGAGSWQVYRRDTGEPFYYAVCCGADTAATPGLARGLADGPLAAALRALYACPDRSWTVAELGAEAALSRSAFFARFSRAGGVAPMEYLLAWCMALARQPAA